MVKDITLGMNKEQFETHYNERVNTPEKEKKFKETLEGILHDRTMCKTLGIDYNNLPEDDIQKAKNYVLARFSKTKEKGR